jgi:hypothetical protein
MRLRSGQNSENYRWLLLLLQQDLVAAGSMGGGPHKFLKAPIEFNDIGANRFAYKTERISVTPFWTTSRLSRLDRTDIVRQLEAKAKFVVQK